jgi:hypothetical protein
VDGAFEGTLLRVGAVLFVTVLTGWARRSACRCRSRRSRSRPADDRALGGAALGARLGATAQAIYLPSGRRPAVFAASPVLPQEPPG